MMIRGEERRATEEERKKRPSSGKEREKHDLAAAQKGRNDNLSEAIFPNEVILFLTRNRKTRKEIYSKEKLDGICPVSGNTIA